MKLYPPRKIEGGLKLEKVDSDPDVAGNEDRIVPVTSSVPQPGRRKRVAFYPYLQIVYNDSDDFDDESLMSSNDITSREDSNLMSLLSEGITDEHPGISANHTDEENNSEFDKRLSLIDKHLKKDFDKIFDNIASIKDLDSNINKSEIFEEGSPEPEYAENGEGAIDGDGPADTDLPEKHINKLSDKTCKGFKKIIENSIEMEAQKIFDDINSMIDKNINKSEIFEEGSEEDLEENDEEDVREGEDTTKRETRRGTDGLLDSDFPSEHDFDFEHLSKPKTRRDSNQVLYRRICRRIKIIPNYFIARNLNNTRLILRGQTLGPRGIRALCSALFSNCTVTELEISEDVISTQTMSHICEMLEENDFINYLDLSDNKMGPNPVKLLMETLLVKDRILSLSLSGNDLKDTDAEVFKNYIPNTSMLETLDLSYNEFRQEAGRYLGTYFAQNTSIQTLSLRWNQLNFKGAATFINQVGLNKSITTLDLAWNGLGESGVDSLTRMIRKNQLIEELDVSSNRINFKSLTDLLTALKKNNSICTLNIGENILSSNDAHKLLNHLLSMKGDLTLKNLSLGRLTIDLRTLDLVNSLLDDKDIMVTHGPVYGLKVKTDAEELSSLNPVTLLLEFGSLLEMTLEELFDYIDADGGGTLDRDELREGLGEFDIPLPERSLDILIRKMDSNGDGQIALSDLQSADSSDEKDFIKLKIKARCMPGGGNVETEKIRCRKILKRLMNANTKSTIGTKVSQKDIGEELESEDPITQSATQIDENATRADENATRSDKKRSISFMKTPPEGMKTKEE